MSSGHIYKSFGEIHEYKCIYYIYTHTHRIYTNNKSSSTDHLGKELFSSSPRLSQDNWLINLQYMFDMHSHLNL